MSSGLPSGFCSSNVQQHSIHQILSSSKLHQNFQHKESKPNEKKNTCQVIQGVTFFYPPHWRSLNHPKKVTLNHQVNDSRKWFVLVECGFASSTKIRFKARTNEWNAAKSKSTSLSHMTCLGSRREGSSAGNPKETAVETGGGRYRLNNKRSPIIPQQTAPQAIPKSPKIKEFRNMNCWLEVDRPMFWRGMLENNGRILR